MNTNKHEVYFDRFDFLRQLEYFEDSQPGNCSEEQLLLVAKAYFIEQLYSECIHLLKKIQHRNRAKILFEKYTLLFKVSYLLDNQNTDSLTSIIDEFLRLKQLTTEMSFQNYHLNVFREFRAFVDELIRKNSQNLSRHPVTSQEIATRRQEGNKIQLQQNTLRKSTKIQGFPCFLVSKGWRKRQQNYYNNQQNVWKKKDKKFRIIEVEEDPSHPGPIDNFTIVNHIFQIIPHESKSTSHLNNILFPGEQYEVVDRKHWKYLSELYGGIPVKQVYGTATVSRLSDQVLFNEKMLSKLLISFNNKIEIIQVPSSSLWPYSVLPHLYKRYGLGQLKQSITQNNYRLVGNALVFQPQNFRPLKYVSFLNYNIKNLTPDDVKFRDRMFYTFDFEKYSIENSQSNGLVGLTNDKFLCFMNSSLQCLSNTYDLSKYFLSNEYVQDLIFSKSNESGSRGQITCAYGDIVKKLWNLNWSNKKQAQINPSVFKQVFSKRFQIFMEDSQEDAHQFLNFLLNCMHDDLNKSFKAGPNKELKKIKDTTNFEDVRKAFMQNYESNNNSKITNLLSGYTYSTLKCLNCETKYYNFDTHLTFPLPIPLETQSLNVFYMNSGNPQSDFIRYNVFLSGLIKANDIIKLVQERRSNLNPVKIIKRNFFQQNQFYLLGVNRQNYKVQQNFSTQTNIPDLVDLERKLFFCLYEVPRENQTSNQTINLQNDIEVNSSEGQTCELGNKLTLIQYIFDDERRGLPKLMYINSQMLEEKLVQIAAEAIPDNTLKYSGGAATQAEKISCIEKIKLHRIKGKPYANVMKVKLSKNLSLINSQEKIEDLGEKNKTRQITLHNCLDRFREKDLILQKQGWRCGRCKKVSDCEKQEKIYSVGSHLIIVLKRFKEGQKVCTKVDYPLEGLDITEFVDENYKQNKPHMKFIFDLYGVIVHRGSLNRGHYFSYCKNKHTGKWYLFDDEFVKEEEDLDTLVSENAYILFYRNRSAL